MIKAVAKIYSLTFVYQPVNQNLKQVFIDAVVKITGEIREKGLYKTIWKYKTDDIGRQFLEIIYLFKDMDSVSLTFNSEKSKIIIEKLRKKGFQWSLETYKISPMLEKIYLEEIRCIPEKLG